MITLFLSTLSKVSTQMGASQMMKGSTVYISSHLLITHRMKIQNHVAKKVYLALPRIPAKQVPTSHLLRRSQATTVCLSSRLPSTLASLKLDNFTPQAAVLTNTAMVVPKDVVSEMYLGYLNTSGLHPNLLMG